jgi:malate permease and related proteins
MLCRVPRWRLDLAQLVIHTPIQAWPCRVKGRGSSYAPVPLMQILLVLLPILAPVFITAAAGFAWTKWGGGFDSRFVARIVTYVFAPALIFDTLTSSKIEAARILGAAGAIFACMLLAGAAGYVLLRLLKAPFRAYLPALMFPNLGNIGGPICLFAFGDEGLAYAVAIMATGSITLWTLGAWISSGELSPRRALMTPPVLAAIIGAVFMVLAVPIPGWIRSTLSLLAAPTFPLMLMALGSSLATMKISNARFSVGLGAFRIIIGTLIGIAISEALGLKGALRGVIILQSSMPSAVFNYLFAELNDRHPDEVAGLVVASTLLAVFSLPLIVAYVLSLH